jgi:hypothetical protein
MREQDGNLPFDNGNDQAAKGRGDCIATARTRVPVSCFAAYAQFRCSLAPISLNRRPHCDGKATVSTARRRREGKSAPGNPRRKVSTPCINKGTRQSLFSRSREEKKPHVGNPILPLLHSKLIQAAPQRRGNPYCVRAIYQHQPKPLCCRPQVFPARAVPRRAEEGVERRSLTPEDVARGGGWKENEEEPNEGHEEGGEEDGGGEVEFVVEAHGGLPSPFFSSVRYREE